MAAPINSLFDAFGRTDDPRKARGARHPYPPMLALTSLGLLCRQTAMAGLRRWAEDHWRTLKGPSGFTRKEPPHAATISRAVAEFSSGQSRDAFVTGHAPRRGVGGLTGGAGPPQGPPYPCPGRSSEPETPQGPQVLRRS